MLPAVGQGALGLEARADRRRDCWNMVARPEPRAHRLGGGRRDGPFWPGLRAAARCPSPGYATSDATAG